MKFDNDNLSVEYWKKKLTKYKGQKRTTWCNKIINYIYDIMMDVKGEKKIKQLETCITELEKIRDNVNYNKYENIAKMWTIVKEIDRNNWTGREWWQLNLITYGSNKDRYPNLKL